MNIPEHVTEEQLRQALNERGLLTENVERGLAQANASLASVKRDTGAPKLTEHIYPLAMMAMEHFKEACDEDIVLLVLLHDVLEDSETSEERLLEQFPKQVVEGVKSLTKRNIPGMSEEEAWEHVHTAYFEQLRTAPRQVQIIKLLDRIDNLHWMHTFSGEEKDIYLEETPGFYIPLARSIDEGLAEEMRLLLQRFKERRGQ